MESCSEDLHWMQQALAAAQAVKGSTYPNPAVGAVLVKDGKLLATGATRPAGGVHAEVLALETAGRRAVGGTLYVTLEPCCHYGRTPPCTDAIVAAGIHRVVVACRDPDSRVNGAGIARLQAAGVIVEEGLLHEEARHLNREFFLYSNSGRPFITLKYAMTLDGHLACEGGDSRWISGEESRAFVHQLRKECQAVLIGNGTLERDDPTLDCRLPGIEGIFQPFPIILSSSGSVREAAQLWQRPGAMLVTTRSGAIRVGLHPQPRMVIVDDGAPLAAILQELGRQEIVSLLVEGGTQVLTGFLRERLVDRIVVFAAPKICGGHSTPVADLGIRSMADAIACRGSWRLLGPDACFDGEVVRDA